MEIKENTADDIELLPGDRARLAVLAIRFSDDGEELPGFLHEQLHRLDKQIKADGAVARSTHWQLNAGKALMAARRYIELQNSDTPISLDDVAKQFGTSPRSVSRYIKQLRMTTGANGKGERVS